MSHRSSVTVSIGEERKGVLRTMFLVALCIHSHQHKISIISSTEKDPLRLQRDVRCGEVNVSRKDQEVIISQTTILPGVHELL